jgi:hypothetical protein
MMYPFFNTSVSVSCFQRYIFGNVSDFITRWDTPSYYLGFKSSLLPYFIFWILQVFLTRCLGLLDPISNNFD